jgi:vacuolar iron transporter family protein
MPLRAGQESGARVTERADVARYRANLQGEIDGAALYRALAAAERRPQLADVYGRLAATEERHARHWESQLSAAGARVPPRRPGWQTRTLCWLARRLGPQVVLPTVASLERVDSNHYDAQVEARAAGLPREERSHARLLQTIIGPGRGLEGSSLIRLEGRHRSVGGNALRAAVLGANDGLVSNLSLVMGVAGAQLSGRGILITGLAGLLAGAGSMALGEWLSVQSARELYRREIQTEAEELAAVPKEEEVELALIYQAKGLPEDQSRALAKRLIANRGEALDTLAREELGVDPQELGGSAWEAAITSLVLFALGAVVPLAPFMVLAGTKAVAASLGASAVALFVIGAGITLLTRRGLLYTGVRQVLFGLAAAALTFGIGRLIGVSLAG